MIWPCAGRSARNLGAPSASEKISSISSLVKSAIEITLRISIPMPSLPVGHRHLIDAVGLLQPYVHSLTVARIDILANDIGADGQLARAAIDQYGHEYSLRLTEPFHRFHRGANCPAAKNHVVDQYDDLVIDRHRRFESPHRRGAPLLASVVAVGRDVDDTDRSVDLRCLSHPVRQTARQVDAARTDTNQDDAVGCERFFDDLMRHAVDRPAKILTLQNNLSRVGHKKRTP